MENDIVARRIRAFRKLKGYTQSELSAELGISVDVLGSVERGTRMPEQQLLEQLSDILDIELDELTASGSHTSHGKGM